MHGEAEIVLHDLLLIFNRWSVALLGETSHIRQFIIIIIIIISSLYPYLSSLYPYLSSHNPYLVNSKSIIRSIWFDTILFLFWYDF